MLVRISVCVAALSFAYATTAAATDLVAFLAGTTLNEALQSVSKSLPNNQRQALDAVVDDLRKMPIGEVYLLQIDDPCGDPLKLNCRGLPPAKVSAAIKVLVDRSKALQDAEQAETSRNISIGSLVVSASSLLISFLTFRSKKKEGEAKSEAVREKPPHEESGE
jgi:hypothetical protein